MIRTISIQNYAIIESLEIQFSNQLSIITGETGAGKSILLGALGLVMGKRADTKVLFDQSSKCVIEAVFDVSSYHLQEFYAQRDLDYEAETVIRREITPTGKSRAFINDTPVVLGVLQELCEQLIDLHQQFDTLNIQDPMFQLRVVDALAGCKSQTIDYQQKYRRFDETRKQLAQLVQRSQQAGKESDFLQFQLDELQKAKLRKGEQEELETEQKQLSHAEEIKKVLNRVAAQLNDHENCMVEQMQSLLHKIEQISEYHPQLPSLSERFEGLLVELQDVASDFQGIADDTEYDGERLEEIAERLDTIYRLQNKHNTDGDGLLDLQEDLESKLQSNEDLSEEIVRLEKAMDIQNKELWTLGKDLAQKRRGVTENFQKEVQKMLSQLSMPHALLQVQIEDAKDLLPTGINVIRYLFAPNKGSRFEEIKNVASGGELSRLALCIKSMIANALPLPTLIFDEIDSGVSGEVALQMGLILQKLATDHQVISITHSPQIAAKANEHFFVHKKVQGERTITGVRQLAYEERVEEIAKMLSGNPPSEFAKQNAKELLAR